MQSIEREGEREGAGGREGKKRRIRENERVIAKEIAKLYSMQINALSALMNTLYMRAFLVRSIAIV